MRRRDLKILAYLSKADVIIGINSVLNIIALWVYITFL